MDPLVEACTSRWELNVAIIPLSQCIQTPGLARPPVHFISMAGRMWPQIVTGLCIDGAWVNDASAICTPLSCMMRRTLPIIIFLGPVLVAFFANRLAEHV